MRHGTEFEGAHPDEDTIEAFALGRLEAASVLTHVTRCDVCAEHVAEVRLLRQALARWKQTHPTVLFEHHTPAGVIRGTYQCSAGRYVARVLGPDIDCTTFSDHPAAAVDWCTTTFAEMFPHHQCGEACSTRSQ